jgi:proteic killer suppression protein
MIRSFKHKGLRDFFQTGSARGLNVQNSDRIRRILLALEAASCPEDLNLPGFRFHALSGKLASRYAVNASGNWRITFGWDGNSVVDVDLEDYH